MIPARKRNDYFPALFNDFWNDDFMNNFFENKSPAVNVVENKKEYRIEIAAPGLSKDDFKVDVDKNRLEISAEKKTEHEEKNDDDQFLRREFSYTSFVRSFVLPEGIDTDGISAKQKDGVIEIKLPKKSGAKEEQKKRIEIK
jgi:HSP20 family protein